MCFLIEEQRPVIICMLRVIQQRIRQRILKNCTDALAFYFEMLCAGVVTARSHKSIVLECCSSSNVVDDRERRIVVSRWRTGFTELRNTEIENFDAITTETIRLEPDVVRLQVSMDDALLVCLVNGRANLIEDVSDPFERQTLLFRENIA